MSEMDWEYPPEFDGVEIQVPRVHDWYTDVATGLTNLFYPRGRFFIAWGWVLWFIVIPWMFVKALLYFGILALLTLIFGLTASVDAITYLHRVKKARERQWTEYMLNLHDQPPPTGA